MDFVTELRETLQDMPDLNHILLEREDGTEYTDPELQRHVKRALADINMKPPVTNYSLENFPVTHWKLIIDGAIIDALRMKGILKVRNDMPYQDQGGVNVNLEGKGERYHQYAMGLWQTHQEQVATFKNAMSLNDGWGGISSDFSRGAWWW